jgi:hypothetical protein
VLEKPLHTPMSPKAAALFKELYGVSIEEASSSLEIREQVASRIATCSQKGSEPAGGFGRGHVAFGRAIPAKDADADTMRIISSWH